MFYRYISENLTYYINSEEIAAGNTDFDYAQLLDEEAEEAREDLIPSKGFFILPSELFVMYANQALDDENLNETSWNEYSVISKNLQKEVNQKTVFQVCLMILM